MASSRERVCVGALALLSGVMGACSVGHGEGEIHGTVAVLGCRSTGPYSLDPTAFFAQATEQLLRLRIQRGSDLEVRSDGIALLVEDATQLKLEFLGQDIDVRGFVPRVDISLFLNESCPPGRDRVPVALSAVSGTVRFEEIYAPEVSKDEVEIEATLTDVRFEDPNNPGRFAELSGFFNFLYTRGSPAQRFP